MKPRKGEPPDIDASALDEPLRLVAVGRKLKLKMSWEGRNVYEWDSRLEPEKTYRVTIEEVTG